MKRIWKRTFAVLLVVLMIGGTAPIGVLAELDWPMLAEGYFSEKATNGLSALRKGFAAVFDFFGGWSLSASAAVISGECGEKVTWTLDLSTGLLKISGSGQMTDYISSSAVPWYGYKDNIKSVKVGSGVTNIGDYAFDDCTSLTSVMLSDSITRIGFHAFCNCGFTSIIIPDNVTTIWRFSFFGTSLTSITIPDSVKTIGAHAFGNCANLTSIEISDSVTTLEVYAFEECGLTSITIPDSVTTIEDYLFIQCSSLEEVTIPNSVTIIGDKAFAACTSLMSITFPNSLTEIGWMAFLNCSNLTSVTIPDSVRNIHNAAFLSCENLEDVYYSGNESQWNSITIGNLNDPLTSATIHFNSTGGDVDHPGTFGDYGVSFEQDKYKATLGDTFDIRIHSLYLPQHEAGDLIWKSSDESVSIVPHDRYATVTAEKPGYSIITVSSHGGGYSDHCLVFVGDQSLVIGKQNGRLKVGTEQEYMVSLCNSDFVNMSDNKTVSIDHAYASAEDISEITFVIADQSIATITSTVIENGVIGINVKGIREGITYVTVTYNTTGETRYFPLCVTNDENTYYINSIPAQKSDNGKTYNICQSGIYIYNFKVEDGDESYSTISFDAYNTTGIIGSVDVYDENGNLGKNVMIKSFDFQPTDPIKGIKTLYYLIPAICTLTYNDITKPFNSSRTSVSFKLPTNGYFKINNDVSASFPCLIYNAVDLTVDSISMFAGLKSTLSNDSKNQVDKKVTEKIVDYIRDFKAFGSESKAVLKTLSKLKDEMLKDADRFDVKNIYSIMDELCTHLSLNIDYVELVKSTLVNILKSAANDVLLTFDTTGVAKYLYKYQKWENYCTTLTDLNMYNGDGSAFIYNIQGGTKRISNGIIFEGSAEDVAVFRTYEVSYGNMVEDLNKNYAKAKLYDITLVKNNELTQPNAIAKILIPIPFGYDKTGLKVYRINDNGSKTDMNGRVEGSYLVFETNHFSLYALVEDNPIADAKLNFKSAATVDYRSKVSVTFTADGVPEGYYIIIVEEINGKATVIASGDNRSATADLGKVTSNREIFAWVIKEGSAGKAERNRNGEIIGGMTSITVKSGFFYRLIAFFRILFGILPIVEIKP